VRGTKPRGPSGRASSLGFIPMRRVVLAAFPLTPALSLGEREPRIPSPWTTKRLGSSQAWQMSLPLPKGEGWGEGEQIPASSHRPSISGTVNLGESSGKAGGLPSLLSAARVHRRCRTR
jgi:hypothetical protein